MRASKYLLSTLKEAPAEAVVVSHKLMVRAGYIRKIANGLYTWMPTGLRVLNKVTSIIREEMNKAGAIELTMPVVQPAELWQESGRWEHYGPELCRFKDRHDAECVLGPTHEEVITSLVRNEVSSYRQLPINLYQFQTKFRDEIRPRFGVMRSREFVMKDAYSFHMDRESLGETYEDMYRAYSNSFSRMGLDFRAVRADTGSIGGSSSHEFQVLANSGEDLIAFSTESDFAANIELTEALAPTEERKAPAKSLEKVATPGCHSVDDVAQFLKADTNSVAKTMVVLGECEEGQTAPVIAMVLRGNHELNEVKAEKIAGVAKPLTLASDEQIEKALGCHPGSIGPVGFKGRIIVDRSAAVMSDFICGANEDGFHLAGTNWDRDVQNYEVMDLRNVEEGDPSPDGNGTIVLKRGIEVGHIFQLGKKYSEAMRCTALNSEGKAVTLEMGCYGIGVTRVVAAAIEQNHDEHGIKLPRNIAPFDVSLIPMNMKKNPDVAEYCEKLYAKLCEQNLDTLFDDREERPGVMFADHELIGVPAQIVVGSKALATGKVELKNRITGVKSEVSSAELLANPKAAIDAIFA